MLDTGEKGENDMKKKTTYKQAPPDIEDAILSSTVVRNIIPPPEKLLRKEETVKVTLSLSKDSVLFFKKKAEEQGVSYQNMIRALIDRYTEYYNHTE